LKKCTSGSRPAAAVAALKGNKDNKQATINIRRIAFSSSASMKLLFAVIDY
jgi:hypothetical protein